MISEVALATRRPVLGPPGRLASFGRPGFARCLAFGYPRFGHTLAPEQSLPDGSYLAYVYPSPKARRHRQDGILVRVVEYTIDDPTRTGHGERHRLLTLLLDCQSFPATLLANLLDDLLMEIAREVLPPRELRCNPRVVKRKMSNFRLKRQEDYHLQSDSGAFRCTARGHKKARSHRGI